ncbi:MAG: class I adenylate-forming enzyme family protein [Burkholderiales bacterium]
MDFLSFYARYQPEARAIQRIDGSVTYAELFFLVRQIAKKLRIAGVRPGQLVVSCFAEPLNDWVVTLALFHEATITCSNPCMGDVYAPIDPCLKVDWAISNRKLDGFPAEKTILIDVDWVNDARNLTGEIEAHRYPSEDSLCRLILTSGTTGQPKAAAFTVGTIHSRLKQSTSFFWSSEMCMMPLCTIGGFMTALLCLVKGRPFYLIIRADNVLLAISRFGIASLAGSPNQLNELVNAASASSARLASLSEVTCSGGALSKTLLDRIRKHLCPNVISLYGSTEVGSISKSICSHASDTGGEGIIAGYVLPDVQVEIVDESDNKSGPGAEGSIRIKNDSMVREYYQNHEATAQCFRDGWFYPGDRGKLAKDGLLVLTGRDSELINKGGSKIDPVPIDQFMADYAGVEDAAAFGLESKMGIHDVAAALVVQDDFDLETLHRELLGKFGAESCPFILFRIDRIPRNTMGKVMRSRLSQAFIGHVESPWAARA